MNEFFNTYYTKNEWLYLRDLTAYETQLPGGSYIQELGYSYDNVGNILSINQQSGTVSGLGGPYYNTYQYDNRNRLTQSASTTSNHLRCHLSMSYSPAGRLGLDSIRADVFYKDLVYGYDDQTMTHQPRVIFDYKTNIAAELFWDANGNLSQIADCNSGNARFHLWSEENRLHAVIGPLQAGLYGYDGNGNRVWKLTGTCSNHSQNGGISNYSITLDDAVLYPNPYLTITPHGYTKHYYVGTERLATATGQGCWPYAMSGMNNQEVHVSKKYWEYFDSELFGTMYNIPEINVDIEGQKLDILQYQCSPNQLEYLTISGSQNILHDIVSFYKQLSGKYDEIFYIHNNHLGSASWITSETGHPVQYIHYAPYGELIDNQSTGYDERYKFIGKERDEESGYDNFGARYWWIVGTWLSVNPLTGDYPQISPYAYCAWNPLRFVDPDGREWIATHGLASDVQIMKNKSLPQTLKDNMLATNRRLRFGMDKRGNTIGALNINNVFELFAHGSRDGAGIYDKFSYINNPHRLFEIFDSSPYLSSKNSNSSIYILYSCYTGSGKNSIAQQLSGIKEVQGSVVIAATGPVVINEKGNEYVKDGGNWNVFYKGKQVMIISGEEGAMTKFMQNYLKNGESGIKQFLKQCEQQSRNTDK